MSMTTIQYRPRTTEEASTPKARREMLTLHLGIWQTKAQHAKGAHKAQCLAAVADLQARIAAI